MDLTIDSGKLIKKICETQNELDEVENTYRNQHPTFTRYSTSYIPNGSKPVILPFRTITSKPVTYQNGSKPVILPFRTITSKPVTYHQPSKVDIAHLSEESTHEDEFQRNKVCLKSAIVSKRSNPSSRKDVIKQQNVNCNVRTRNCRILKMLQGTLQKFKDDAIKSQPQDLKRKRLEEKVEAANEEEKQRLKREKKELLYKIKEKQSQLERLKEMLMITESFEAWKYNKEHLLSFIATKAKPHIYYLPTCHTSKSKEKLFESGIEIQKTIQRQEEAVKMELAKVEKDIIIHEADFTTVELVETENAVFPCEEQVKGTTNIENAVFPCGKQVKETTNIKNAVFPCGKQVKETSNIKNAVFPCEKQVKETTNLKNVVFPYGKQVKKTTNIKNVVFPYGKQVKKTTNIKNAVFPCGKQVNETTNMFFQDTLFF